ncbi:CDC45 family [Pilobolus umbonatus]|nr:CDC45 family [Pilobolus umbonatus]
MVKITEGVYQEAYEYIKKDANTGNTILFVSADIDSICAIRQFQALLKADVIQHKFVPVSGYADLIKANEELVKKDKELKTIILINCGGQTDVNDLFSSRPQEIRIYIIDSHRPLHLNNLSSKTENVCTFIEGDELMNLKEILSAYDYLENNVHSIIHSDSDSEDEYGRIRDRRPHRRRRLSENIDEPRGVSNMMIRKYRRLIDQYYASGTYHASSVAAMVYTLVNQLSKSNNELLWLAIIGVTSQYIFENISTEKYAKYLTTFNDDRARLNINTTENDKNTVIKAEDEYRFILYRHWSLYESMYHSSYVSSKLALWKDVGKKRLNHLFAQMGFSLQQCTQIYTHMDMRLKRMLQSKIETVAPLYGLTDICFPSFVRVYGWECHLSASDVVYSLTALIETSPAAANKLRINKNGDDYRHNVEPVNTPVADDDDDDDGVRQLQKNGETWWLDNFYNAYDALGEESPKSLLNGIEICINTQKTIVRQATAIIEKKLTRLGSSFRYVLLESGPDLPVFQHSLVLTKLGLFLVDVYREHASKNLPVVVSALNEENRTCLLKATACAGEFGTVMKNRLCAVFMDTAKRNDVPLLQDDFDPNVLEVDSENISSLFSNMKVQRI